MACLGPCDCPHILSWFIGCLRWALLTRYFGIEFGNGLFFVIAIRCLIFSLILNSLLHYLLRLGWGLIGQWDLCPFIERLAQCWLQCEVQLAVFGRDYFWWDGRSACLLTRRLLDWRESTCIVTEGAHALIYAVTWPEHVLNSKIAGHLTNLTCKMPAVVLSLFQRTQSAE